MEINKALDLELGKLGIYQLRNLARQLGVSSPTTKKREILLESIKDIMSGDVKPIVKTKAGRPAKAFRNSDNLLADFLTQSDEDVHRKVNSLTSSNGITFEEILNLDTSGLAGKYVEVRGILRKTSNGSYYLLNDLFISTRLYVIVQESMVKNMGILEGDLLYGLADKMPDKDVAVMSEVQTIMGKKPQDCELDAKQEYILPYKMLEDSLYPIKEGQCYLKKIKSGTSEEEIRKAVEILLKKGYDCLCLGIELSIEKKLRLDKIENLKVISTMYDDPANFSYEAILDAISHAKALFLRKRKVVLFVLDLFSIYSLLDMYFISRDCKVAVQHTMETVQVIKMLLGLAKVSENAGITVISDYFDGEQLEFARDMKDIKRLCFCED